MTYDLDRIIFLFFMMLLANLCLNLAILLIIMNMASKKRLEETEQMLMRFLIIISLIICISMAQEEYVQAIDPYVEEEDPPIALIPEGDKPVVFPEPMAKAASTITDIFIGNESDHNLFLSDAYWPVPIGNNTTLNLTA